jgi:signal transduction histidine kinase
MNWIARVLNSWRLPTKALVLVFLPLAFELGFFLALDQLINQAEKEVEAQKHARQVVTQMNRLMQLLLDSAAGLSTYGATGQHDMYRRYLKSTTRLPQELDVLEQMVRGHKEEEQIVASIRKLAYSGMSEFAKVRALIDQGDLLSAKDKMTALKPLSRELYSQFDRAVAQERSIEDANVETQGMLRNAIRRTMIIGLTANVILAIILIRVFYVSSVSRLDRLVENTKRLAHDEALLPAVEGNDEIAHLDKVFHDMAEQLDAAASERKRLESIKRDLLGIVTHELNTPLTSARASLELLLEGVYGDMEQRAKDHLSLSLRSLQRVLHLSGDILAAERVHSGTLSLNKRETKSVDYVWKALEMVAHQSEEKAIYIEGAIGLYTVNADEDRLVQVMINFLNNAIKFSNEKARISICVRKILTDKGSQLLTEIADNGRGVPPAFANRIFEKFVQVRPKDDSSIGGSGLGLAICKVIIDQHAGTIGVRENPEGGSIFWFTIPSE